MVVGAEMQDFCAAPPLVVTVQAKERCRHAGLTCEACGQDAVIGVVYALATLVADLLLTYLSPRLRPAPRTRAVASTVSSAEASAEAAR